MLEKDTELWLPILGYEDLYEVSSIGRVKSVERYVLHSSGSSKKLKEKILKFGYANYKNVSLCKDGKAKTYTVHRLVALSFVENPHSYNEVNHIDGDKENNTFSNLEWCDRSYNIKYSFKNQLQVIDPRLNPNYSKKLSAEQADYIVKLCRRHYKPKLLAKMFNVDRSTISRIINNKYWKINEPT